jgi:hypothetical protein
VAVLCQTSQSAIRNWRSRRRVYAAVAVLGFALVLLPPLLHRAFEPAPVRFAAAVAILCGLAWFVLCGGAGRRKHCYLRVDRQKGTIAGAFARRQDTEEILWD